MPARQPTTGGRRVLDLELARLGPHPEVPLRRQIAAWVASGIRDGEVAEGKRLPSVRRLAELVGVHRNTAWAAYRELARSGLVRPVEGSGVYVVYSALRDRRRDLVAESDGGRWPNHTGDALVCAACRSPGRPQRPLGPRALVVVEDGADLRAVLVAELRRALGARGVRVRGASTAAVAAPGAPTAPSAVWEGFAGFPRSAFHVGLPTARRRLAARLGPTVPIESLALRGGRSELRQIARLPPGSVVAVLTVSYRVRTYARELLAGWPNLVLAAPRPDDEAAVARALRVADLVWVDASFWGRPVNDGGLGKGRVRLLRCIRSDSLERVALRLGVPRRGLRRTREVDRRALPDRTRSREPGAPLRLSGGVG